MYLFIGILVVAFVAAIIEVYFHVPTIERLRNCVSEMFTGRGYRRFFGLTALFAVSSYVIGLALMGPFIGLYESGIQVGTLFLLFFVGGMLRSIFSGVGDVGRFAFGARPRGKEFSVFSSVIFMTGLWGCVILLCFYDHARSGALIGVSINL